MTYRQDGSGQKTVDKAMRVLHAFSHERPEFSIGDLSRELSMHKSIVSRLVSALRKWRLLEQDPHSRRVRMGPGAFKLGSLFANRQNIVRTVTPYLGALAMRTGHSAHAVVLDGTRLLVIATAESPSAVRVLMRVGEHRFLHATASGKLFLALSDQAMLAAALKDPGLPKLTPCTVVEPAELLKALQRVRRERVSWNQGESTVGAGAIAAPVIDGAGHIVAAISVVYPLNMVNAAQRQKIAKDTSAAAREVSDVLRTFGQVTKSVTPRSPRMPARLKPD
jgi:DNA-binding IclR family transcriptional regulator